MPIKLVLSFGFGAGNTKLYIYEVLIYAFINTLIVSCISILFATILGFIIGLIPIYGKNIPISRFPSMYVSLFRNIPLYVQILIWYFGVFFQLPDQPISFGFLAIDVKGLYIFPINFTYWTIFAFIPLLMWKRSNWFIILFLFLFLASLDASTLKSFNVVNETYFYVPSEFIALSIALSIFSSAYIVEIISFGLKTIPSGQFEAAQSLGLSFYTMIKAVLLPQLIPKIKPLLTIQYVNIFKNSSLGALIGFPELMGLFSGTILNYTNQNFEVMIVTLLCYFVICQLTLFVFNASYDKTT